MRSQLLPALRAVLVMTAVCGLAYPLVVTGVAQVAFADRANGSLVERDGEVVGSSLLGQAFTGAGYFHPRPSAAADGVSGASNLGPTNPDLLAAVVERATVYRRSNGLDAGAEVPVDAVTASASGLDPDISVANARLQAPRVAERRGLGLDLVLDLVDRHTRQRPLGFLGERGVNVLELNLALDDVGGGTGSG